MVNLVKEHIPLWEQNCTGIVSQCQKTELIDQLAQEKINQQISLSPESLLNRANHFELSPNKITVGQGEYIVFHKLPAGEKQQLSPEMFEQVYQVLLQHSPAAFINSGSEKTMEGCANRYELLKTKLKEIDLTLEIVFIPRTLYELIFIRKCIQEDLKHKEICPRLEPFSHKITLKTFKNDEVMYQEFLKGEQEEKLKRKCWHLCYFTDAGDYEHAGVKDVAYRLNQTMCKAFDPSSEGFTYQELSDFVEKEIEFLKTYHKKGLEAKEKLLKGEKVEILISTSIPGPTSNFGYDSALGAIKPMGIRNETDAQMIRDTIALDCSKIAQHSFFLYRGADFKKDSTSLDGKPYSLSYGSSLFAGCLYDGGATAFYFMRNGENAYAIPVAFDQLNNSPFFIPTTHTVAQLFGDGEVFHARTKAWKDFDIKEIGGMNIGPNRHMRDHLKSNLSREELNTQFETYKNKAFQLK